MKSYTDPDMDIAYQILKDNDSVPMNYKELVLKMLEKQNYQGRIDAAKISEVYTQINMDGRFYYMNNGNWGLTEWVPVEVAKRRRGRKKKEIEDEEE